MLPDVIIKDIQKKFNILIEESSPLKGGIEHLTYLAITNKHDRLVIRLYRNRTKELAELEAKLLDELSSQDDIGAHIAPMLGNLEGKKIQEVGENIYCVSKFIDGFHPIALTDSQLNYIIKLINKIHVIGMDKYLDFTRKGGVPNFVEIQSSLFKYYSNKILKVDEYNNLKNIICKFQSIEKNYNIKTIIHYDIHKGNILIDKLSDIPFLIDFDDFIIGSPILDIAGMVRGLCALGAGNRSFDIKLAKAIISQYNFSSVGEKFQANEFIVFILADLVRVCEAFLRRIADDKRAAFLGAYRHIVDIQANEELIANELAIYNTTYLSNSTKEFDLLSNIKKLPNNHPYLTGSIALAGLAYGAARFGIFKKYFPNTNIYENNFICSYMKNKI